MQAHKLLNFLFLIILISELSLTVLAAKLKSSTTGRCYWNKANGDAYGSYEAGSIYNPSNEKKGDIQEDVKVFHGFRELGNIGGAGYVFQLGQVAGYSIGDKLYGTDGTLRGSVTGDCDFLAKGAAVLFYTTSF